MWQWIQICLAACLSMNVVLGSIKLFTWATGSKSTQNNSENAHVDDHQVKDIKKKVSFDLKNTKYIKNTPVKNTERKDQASNTVQSLLHDQEFQEVIFLKKVK